MNDPKQLLPKPIVVMATDLTEPQKALVVWARTCTEVQKPIVVKVKRQ